MTTKRVLKPATVIKHVMKEIDNIKKYATKEEIAALDVENIDPDSSERCIYGQMTGNCFGDRANVLVNVCASKIQLYNPLHGDILSPEFLNCKKVKRITKDSTNASFLEMFIYQQPHNNKNIAKYIKGDIGSLKLTWEY